MSPISIPGKVTLKQQGVNFFTPASVSTALWLDAADASTVTTVSGAVSQWNDKSGNSRNVFQSISGSRPTYLSTGFNDKPALSFDPAIDLLQSTSSITTGTHASGMHYFWVATRNGNGGGVVAERSSPLFSQSLWFWDGSAAYISSDGLNNSSRGEISGTDLNKLGLAGGMVSHSQFPGQRDILHLNGAQITVISGTASNITGGTNYFTLGYWNGLICEIIAFSSVQSLDVRQKMEGYLAHKWGLVASLPANHPYKFVLPIS